MSCYSNIISQQPKVSHDSSELNTKKKKNCGLAPVLGWVHMTKLLADMDTIMTFVELTRDSQTSFQQRTITIAKVEKKFG